MLLVLLFGAVALAAAAPRAAAGSTPSVSSPQGQAELRRVIESRYEVLPVSGGILLKPRQARAGIRALEVSRDGVAVNGERVNPRTLRDWLGEDADAVLRLQALPDGERRRLFGLDAGVPSPAPEPPPPPAPTPPVAVTEDEVTSDQDVAEVPAVPSPEVSESREIPAVPEGRHGTGSRVNVGGSVTVREDERVDEAIAVGGSVTVNGEVEDVVTAIGGRARINGKVGGDVTAVGNGVYLGPKAVVDGDVTAVGGTIHREPGSVINGQTSEVGMFPWTRGGRDYDRIHWNPWRPFWGGVSEFFSSVMGMVLMGLLVCLVLLVARRPLERVDRQLTAQPWQSAAVGLAGFIFLGPILVVVTVLLVITIVGCALLLLYPFLFVYLGLLFLLGYAAVAYRLGRWLEARFNRNFGGPYAAALVGVVAIQIWNVLANLFDLLPGPFGFFTFMFWMFAALMQAAAWLTGFGAVILARFGLEPGYWPRRGAPVPPPPPVPGGPLPEDRLPLTDPLANPYPEETYPEERYPEERYPEDRYPEDTEPSR
ncbi:MAG: polymer-forming cytoskeletal protein [Thermoanaerobaculia bacterium]